MGNTSSLSSPLSTQHHRTQTEMIVWGYTRRNQHVSIPYDLIAVIYEYYKAINRYLLLWSGTSRKSDTRCNQISFITPHKDSTNKSQYSLHITNLKDPNSKTPILTKNTFDRLHCGHSIATNIFIPKYLTKQYSVLNTTYDYQMLIRTGGQQSYESVGGTNKCDVILFDSISIKNVSDTDTNPIIDAYYLSLPDLPYNMEHTASIYHNDVILMIGGVGPSHLNRLLELKFTDKHWKWIKNDTVPYTERYGSKLCGICDNNALIIGGFAESKSLDIVDIYGVASGDKVNTLTHMKIGRYKPGCFYDRTRQRVFVGGGYNTSHPAKRSVEYLDLNSNKCILIDAQTIGNHMFSPMIWIDDVHSDILYIAGREIGDHSYSYLDNVECLDLRDGKGWMHYNSLSSMFVVGKELKDQWRSRALLSFCV